jgi:hypothetical protein
MSCADNCLTSLGPLPTTGDGVAIPWGCNAAGGCVAGGCSSDSGCEALSGCMQCVAGECVPKICTKNSDCPQGTCVNGICIQNSATYSDLPWVWLAILVIILVLGIFIAIGVYYYRDKIREKISS